MKTQTILFDLDNTLVRCMVYYDFIRKNLYSTLAKISGFSVSEISDIFNEIETIRVNQKNGFTKQAFLDSVNNARVYIYTKLKEIDEDRAQFFYESDLSFKLISFVSSVYEAPYSIYDDVPSVLKILKDSGVSMYVVTKGSFYGQARKAAMLGEIFDGLFVLPHKNEHTWRGVVEAAQLDINTTVVVGDSIKDDIIPAILIGLRTVLVNRCDNSWVGDPKTERPQGVNIITNFNELIELL
jgi:putative hydrolase of the HAD superfamily